MPACCAAVLRCPADLASPSFKLLAHLLLRIIDIGRSKPFHFVPKMKHSAKPQRAKPRRQASTRKKAVAPSTAKHGATLDPNVVSFGRRFRHIREHADVSLKQIHQQAELPMVWLSRVETGQQALNPDRFADWHRILAMVNSLRSLSDSLDDPRDVYRLVSLLGRPVTIEDMRDICSDVALKTIEQRDWLTWPSTMPLLKQPAVARDIEWAWLWDHVIPKDDIVLDKASVRPHIDAAITGAPGIGKSTLVQIFGVSQTVAAHFPDGILYANQQTADVRVWLARWAEQYGLDLPESGQNVLWRDALRVKLMRLAVLVILDDVRDQSFVEHLLVTNNRYSRVVITSRQSDLIDRLGVASDRVLALQPMTVEQGVELLQAYVPQVSWTDHDSAAARQVVGKLGGIPLAICAVGQSISQVEPGQRAQRWQGILRRLGRDRLTPLEGLREVYDAAYADLGVLQSTYRALGVGTWGAPVDDGWLAALRGFTEQEARREMLGLVSRSLITQHLDNEMRTWYQAHMLIGEHAGNQMNGSERALYSERHAAYLARLLLSEADSAIWQRVATGLPHVDQLRQSAAWCVDHLDTPDHILLSQAVYLGASGRMILDGKLKDTLPLGQALCDLQPPGRVSGGVLWTHGRALFDVGELTEAARLLENGAHVLFESKDYPAAVCCISDSSTAYHEAKQPEAARRTARLGDQWAVKHEAEINALQPVQELRRARQARDSLRLVNAAIEMPSTEGLSSPLVTVATRRMCILSARRLAEEAMGREVTVRRRPIGRLPWTPRDFSYAVMIRQVADLLLAGLGEATVHRTDETGQA
jgi:transcriptional regulator with XRE-family HTH domain